MTTLSELLKNKKEEAITYHDLLNCVEWKSKREEVLDRDNHLCTICTSSKTLDGKFSDRNSLSILYGRKLNGEASFTSSRIHLEVHHKFYIRNLFPWEYDDALITVCNECHAMIHQEQKIPVYFDQSKTVIVNEDPCQKCGGTGFLDMYNHVQNGTCFQCHGTGVQKFWSAIKKEKIFTWQFLYKNRLIFNDFFSGNYCFSEKQLIDFNKYLEVGNPHDVITSGIDQKLRLGLIFNANIFWTDYLKVIYYNEPRVIYAGDGVDIFSYHIDFGQLPFTKNIELNKNKDHQEYLFLDSFGPIESDEDSNHITSEFNNNERYYDSLIEKSYYSNQEIFKVIAGEDPLCLFNDNIYSFIFNKILKDIPDFTIEKFYGLFEKRFLE
ncbi:hypothetical protein [Kaistella yonginensis]|uniref:hypothetical protein n=1 Tax=Kaistella yonginensis TaxID=658267 RepID=UPI0025B4EB97|nr:hypothetical protein [Kaistella yonginensis]MDN3607259.1 hypothetical protein [Kaistella yonginensis]